MNNYPNMQPELTNPTMNTSSMICGIVGLLLCMIPMFGLCAPCLAVILSLLGRGNQMKVKGSGLAGLIMGIVGIAGNIAFLVLIVVLSLMISNQTGTGYL